MNRLHLLKAVTTCVVLAIPHASNAQSPQGSTAQDPVAATTRQLPEDSGPGVNHVPTRPAAHVYLDQAKSILDAVPDANLNHDGKKLLSGLREDFSALAASYRAHGKADREEARATIDGNVAGAVDWHARFSDVERRLAEIVGGGSSYSPSYAPSGTLASSLAGVTPSPATQTRAASNPEGATLVAPVTAPPTTVVTRAAPNGETVVTRAAPAGEVSPSPSPSAAAAIAAQPVANAPAPVASNPPQAPSASAAAAAAAATTTPGTPPATVVTPTGTGITTASSPGAGTGSGATVAGTSVSGVAAAAGVLVSTIGLKNLDPAVRLQLEQFRTTVELFFDATTRLGAS